MGDDILRKHASKRGGIGYSLRYWLVRLRYRAIAARIRKPRMITATMAVKCQVWYILKKFLAGDLDLTQRKST